MALFDTDPLTHVSFSVYENKGVFALLVGSGLSRAAEIPTGWEITLDLIRRVALAQGHDAQADWASWYRDTTCSEPNYSTLLEDLTTSPDERRSILHTYIEPSEKDRDEGRKSPTLAHRAIASLVRAGYIRVIVTTNFDRLIETALREQGIEPTVISSVDALLGAEPLTHSPCYLLKLHGDYKDARILNTDEELSAYPDLYGRLLDRIFDEYGLIVSGWSGEWDHALRAALLRAPSRRYPVYWTAVGELGTGATEIVTQRKARVIRVNGADPFFQELSQRVQTIETTHRQNPVGTELLVASTKRYLAGPEFRIPLEELFANEVSRVLAALKGPDFDTQQPWSDEAFLSRIQRYEALIEPLARMAGVLGRWGGSEGVRILTDLIRSLNREGYMGSGGLSIWLDLRSYPAVLVLTAAGLGMTRADHWAELRQFMNTMLPQEHATEPRRVIDAFFLWGWRGADDGKWHLIKGLERRKTPLSDHLLDVFEPWSDSFATLSPDFEILFERYEMMCALVHLETTSIDQLETMGSAGPQEFVWVPLGRIGWHSQSLRSLVNELSSTEAKLALLSAGIAKGDARFLELSIINIQRIASKMPWR